MSGESCPICQSFVAPGEQACDTCGFVFGSAPFGPPPALPLTCPQCGAVQRAGARVCYDCGAVLAVRALLPGDMLDEGRYIVRGPLASGGMGVVYLASDQRAFGRRVVIKALPDDPSVVYQESAEQLRIEGWTLAEMQHPNIPQLYGYVAFGAQRYLAMEYIDGESIQDHLQPQTPLSQFSQHDVIVCGIALSRALEYVHSRRPYPIVHGDVKPANIMQHRVTGAFYLIDFGNARVYRPELSSLSSSAGAFGTPGYAAPEQYQGQAEPRSDVFGLAATLYHMLTGDDPAEHPFRYPLLPSLGSIGEQLAYALHQEPRARPTAAQFRHQLEALHSGQTSWLLRAPDGTMIEDEDELVIWCERNWASAVRWLGGNLVEQVKLWRGSRRALFLQSMLQMAPSQDHALDGLLAWLDPRGFGVARPEVVLLSRQVALQPGHNGRSGTLLLANTGRRLVEANLVLPAGVNAHPTSVRLAPGTHAQVQLQTARTRRVHSNVRIQHGDDVLAECVLQ